MSLTKEKFLSLLEKDREFRLAVAGLLGYRDLLERLEEHDRKFNEILKELRIHREILEEHTKRLEEHDRKFNEIIMEIRDLKRLTGMTRTDLGALTEAFFSWRVEESIRREAELSGRKIKEAVRNRRVNGKEVDLILVTEQEVHVVEVKIRPSKGDIDDLLSKVEILKETYKDFKLIPVLAGTWIPAEILNYASSKNVRVMKF